MTAPVMVSPSPQGGGPVPSLNPAELRVLEGRANGLTYMQIAAQLRYTYSSTVNVGSRVIDKLGARDMAHAVFLACLAGFLDGRRQRHGDHAGFAAHERRGEDPWACESCAEGERAYRRGRKAARRVARKTRNVAAA